MYQHISLHGFSLTSSIFELLHKQKGQVQRCLLQKLQQRQAIKEKVQCPGLFTNLESVVKVSFVDSPTNPLYTMVLLAGLPFGLTVAS